MKFLSVIILLGPVNDTTISCIFFVVNSHEKIAIYIYMKY